MYLQSIKSVKHNAAMSVNRSILKKSRHIGIGLLQFNPSTVFRLVVSIHNVYIPNQLYTTFAGVGAGGGGRSKSVSRGDCE
jgi:hypothetical protein